jgi:hypothetical protein
MKTMPCLFNRWHDSRYDYGGTYLENIDKGWGIHQEYVRALVTPLAADDRVLIWDLCNEPQSGAGWAKEMNAERSKREHDWLAAIAQTVRRCGARQPVTIGTMVGDNIEAFADLCDVLYGHPYATDRAGLERLIAGFQALRQKLAKPFLVNECIPGGENDRERGAVAKEYCELLSRAGFGWMGWALNVTFCVGKSRKWARRLEGREPLCYHEKTVAARSVSEQSRYEKTRFRAEPWWDWRKPGLMLWMGGNS